MNQKGFLSIIGLIIIIAIILILVMIWFKYYGEVFDFLNKGPGTGEKTNILDLPGIIEDSQRVQQQQMMEKVKEIEDY